jgi:hypothetical protein
MFQEWLEFKFRAFLTSAVDGDEKHGFTKQNSQSDILMKR